jgi:FKBP-type peptidyl-prolyl cis-trans isomerase (trigger factor)
MQVIPVDTNSDHKKLRVSADWEEVRLDYIDIIKSYSQLAVPGFRPGKAPESRVESHYRKNICDDLKARCVERLTGKALKDQKLMAGSRIEISDLDVEPLKPLRFCVQFAPISDFTLPDYSHAQLCGESDEERRDEISEWLLSHTDLSVPDELVREELEFDGADNVEPETDKWAEVARRVKLMITLQRIADHDGVDVDDRDVTERVERMASEYGMSPSDLRQRLLQNGGLFRVRNFLLAEYTLDYLLDIASERASDQLLRRDSE